MKSPWRLAPLVVATFAVIMYHRPGPPPLLAHPRGTRDVSSPRRAVVVGATGATGRKLVDQLLASAQWSVTAVVRRPTFRVASEGAGYVEVVLSDGLENADADAVFAGHDVLFNCLGTTRGGGHEGRDASKAGAENFVHVEVGLTKVVSELAVKAGVKAVSVVTAEGANADFLRDHGWVKYVHPLLYMRTLGEKEQATTDAGFERVTIFRCVDLPLPLPLPGACPGHLFCPPALC